MNGEQSDCDYIGKEKKSDWLKRLPALYDDDLVPPPFPRKIFIELMQTATSLIEFIFNDTIYRHTDGVAMGFRWVQTSPISFIGYLLSPISIIVGYQKTKLFFNVMKPLIYYGYVDDIFVVFKNEDNCEIFLSSLNSLHSSLRFMFEKVLNSSLPFLDVLVEKRKTFIL